jgi:hypothetical protein
MTYVPTTRFELARPCEHHPLKVACLPISPRGHLEFANLLKFLSTTFYFSFKTHFIKNVFFLLIQFNAIYLTHTRTDQYG